MIASTVTLTGPIATLKVNTATAVPFSLNVTTTGATTRDNIDAVTGVNNNFDVSVQLTDADVGTDTLNFSSVAATVTSNAQASLTVGQILTLQGTVSVTVPSEKCNQVTWICLRVQPGTGASWAETATITNNVKCADITSNVSCFPDPSVTAVDDGGMIVYTENAAAKPSVTITVTNMASVANGNNISSSMAAYLDVTAQLSDANLGASGTDALNIPVQTLTVDPVASVALAAGGGSQNFTALPSFKLSMNTCPNIQFLCFAILPNANADFIDAKNGNNLKCINISTRVQCNPDLQITSAAVTSSPVPILNVNVLTTMAFDVAVKNDGPTGRRDIAAATPNFDVVAQLTDADLGGGGVDGLAQGNVTTTLTSGANLALAGGATVILSGSVGVTVPIGASCNLVKYLCFRVMAAAGVTWAETVTANNVKCINITAQVSCSPNPSVPEFSTTTTNALATPQKTTETNAEAIGNGNANRAAAPNRKFSIQSATNQDVDVMPTGAALTSASLPVFIVGIATSTSFSLTVTNKGTMDITAVTGLNYNFAVLVQLSNANVGNARADILGLSKVTATMTSGNQAGLVVGGSLTLQGSVSLTVAAATCNQVAWLCLFVQSGSGASYNEAATGNNAICIEISAKVSCFPDLIITELSNTTETLYYENVTTTPSLSITVKNNATAGNGNNIAASTNSYIQMTAQLTNVNLGLGAIDTLNLSIVSVKFSPTASMALATAATQVFTVTSETFTVVCNSLAACPLVKFFCINITVPSTADFIEANTSNNVMCFGISAFINCIRVVLNKPNEANGNITPIAVPTIPITDPTGSLSTTNASIPVKDSFENYSRFERDLYDWEVAYDAPLPTVLDVVHATDPTSSRLNYSANGAPDCFAVDPDTGQVRVVKQLLKYHRYEFKVYAQKEGEQQQGSGKCTIRIDTYQPKRHWFNITFSGALDDQELDEFLSKLHNLTSWVVRTVPTRVSSEGATTSRTTWKTDSVTFFCLHNNDMAQVDASSPQKSFVNASDIEKKLLNGDGSLSSMFSSHEFAKFKVTSGKRSYPEDASLLPTPPDIDKIFRIIGIVIGIVIGIGTVIGIIFIIWRCC